MHVSLPDPHTTAAAAEIVRYRIVRRRSDAVKGGEEARELVEGFFIEGIAQRISTMQSFRCIQTSNRRGRGREGGRRGGHWCSSCDVENICWEFVGRSFMEEGVRWEQPRAPHNTASAVEGGLREMCECVFIE